MKTHDNGETHAHVVGKINRPFSGRLKQTNTKILVLIFLLACAIGTGYILSSNKPKVDQNPATVLTNARQMMLQQKYNDAYKLLKENENNQTLKASIDYYILISRASLATSKKNEAIQYALKGAELYKMNPAANTGNGYVLQSILTGTYVEKPVQNNNKVIPVPSEDFNSQDFQG